MLIVYNNENLTENYIKYFITLVMVLHELFPQVHNEKLFSIRNLLGGIKLTRSVMTLFTQVVKKTYS